MAGFQEIDLYGARLVREMLDRKAQESQRDALRRIVSVAPLQRYATPSGKPMSVMMTAAGRFGWVSDRTGYHYAPAHPTGVPWPPIPEPLCDIWAELLPEARAPECCLVNYYDPNAKMGLHRDDTEADLSQPVLSISLGDEGLFRIGGLQRGGKTRSVWLRSGDGLILQGRSRLAYHGVDRIRPGTSTLLDRPGRINLTLRVVT